ncbi:MAG: magnesium and cobalt transport protein CorA [Lysobacterales bacterium]|jgi:magnesium transporter|nr:MAG: magnesium and cobalt transport protein CorA [Xanthomonadales bacterium]
MGEVTAAIFRDGEVIDRPALDAAMPRYGEPAFTWIEALDPVESDFAVLQQRFGLHSLAVKDSMSPAQAPKVDVYEDQIFVVLKTARLESDEIKYAGIDAFVSRQHIITVRHGDTAHAHAREKLQSGSRLRPDFILHAIMDLVVNSYFPVVEMVEHEVLSMEQHLLDSFLDRNEITRLFRLRREAIHLQHVLSRMSDVCGKLANLEVPCISAEAKPYFRDVHDRLVRLHTMTGGLVDVIQAVFQASNLLEQQRQSTTTRQLAAWAAILGVPAAIAGVYSMNSAYTAELLGAYGHPAVVAAMLAICLALYIRFKKLRWL